VPVAAKAALDRGVLRLPPVQARVLRTGPGVEHEPRVAADEHHDVRRRIGADSWEGEQARRDLVVGEVAGVGGRELLQVDLAGSHRLREGAKVGAAIAAPRHVAVEGLRRGRHRGGGGEGAAERVVQRRPSGGLAEVLDDRAHHADGARPGGVRGADRLDDVLVDRLAPQQPARALGHPEKVGVLCCERVELRQVLVDSEDVPHAVEDGFGTLAGGTGQRSLPASSLSHDHGLRAPTGNRHGRLERARLLVDSVRRQVGDSMGHDRSPEVDRLAAGAREREGRAPGHEDDAGSYFCSQSETPNVSPGAPPRQRTVVPVSCATAERIDAGSGT
jgi:hypothetical protein